MARVTLKVDDWKPGVILSPKSNIEDEQMAKQIAKLLALECKQQGINPVLVTVELSTQIDVAETLIPEAIKAGVEIAAGAGGAEHGGAK